MFVFWEKDGKLVGLTFEWLRPSSTQKSLENFELTKFNVHPESGSTVGFMTSSLIRNGADAGTYERSNIATVTWP